MRAILILAAYTLLHTSAVSAQCCKDEDWTLRQRLDLRDSVFADTVALRISREINEKLRELYLLQNERLFRLRPNLYIRKA